jgi:hypothetical protein
MLILSNLKLELITQQAMKAGFTGGVVVDFPNSTKAKKYANVFNLQFLSEKFSAQFLNLISLKEYFYAFFLAEQMNSYLAVSQTMNP